MAQGRHKFRANWPAPDLFLLELGRMTSIWGTLESGIDLAITKLAGYDQALDSRALILIAHSNFQQRVHMLCSLCEQLLPEFDHLSNYNSVVTKIEQAQKARNKYAHNAIVSDDKTGKVTLSSYSSRGRLKLHSEVVQLAQIQEATAKIHEANCLLHNLITKNELKPMWERE